MVDSEALIRGPYIGTLRPKYLLRAHGALGDCMQDHDLPHFGWPPTLYILCNYGRLAQKDRPCYGFGDMVP